MTGAGTRSFGRLAAIALAGLVALGPSAGGAEGRDALMAAARTFAEAGLGAAMADLPLGPSEALDALDDEIDLANTTGDFARTRALAAFGAALAAAEGEAARSVSFALFEAGALIDLGDYPAATRAYDRVGVLAAEVGEVVSAAIARNGMGEVASYQGRAALALLHYEKALEIGGTVLDPDHPDMVIWRINKAGAQLDLGLVFPALEETRAIAALIEARPGLIEGVILSGFWLNHGKALQAAGELDAAIRAFETGVALDLDLFGERHGYTAVSLDNLAGALAEAGRWDEALTRAEASFAAARVGYGEAHHFTALIGYNLATLAADAGRPERGRDAACAVQESLAPGTPEWAELVVLCLVRPRVDP